MNTQIDVLSDDELDAVVGGGEPSVKCIPCPIGMLVESINSNGKVTDIRYDTANGFANQSC